MRYMGVNKVESARKASRVKKSGRQLLKADTHVRSIPNVLKLVLSLSLTTVNGKGEIR